MKLPTRGAIYIAANFTFSDNTSGKKLLVLLNNPTSGVPFFFVKTTSQQHSKPQTPGCIEKYHYAYFITRDSDFFNKNTWVQLDDYFPFDPSHVDGALKRIGQLTPNTTDHLVNCFLKINEFDLSQKMRNYLSPPLEQGISALASRFNNKK